MKINYSSIENQYALELVSSMWTNYYNQLLNFPYREEWEIETLKGQILAEKVFDI